MNYIYNLLLILSHYFNNNLKYHNNLKYLYFYNTIYMKKLLFLSFLISLTLTISRWGTYRPSNLFTLYDTKFNKYLQLGYIEKS